MADPQVKVIRSRRFGNSFCVETIVSSAETFLNRECSPNSFVTTHIKLEGVKKSRQPFYISGIHRIDEGERIRVHFREEVGSYRHILAYDLLTDSDPPRVKYRFTSKD